MTILTIPEDDKMRWSVADAKARLSEVVTKARTEGPQIITKNGTETAVVVSVEEWQAKTQRKGSLAAFLMTSPLRASELEIGRGDDAPRGVDFGADAP